VKAAAVTAAAVTAAAVTAAAVKAAAAAAAAAVTAAAVMVAAVMVAAVMVAAVMAEQRPQAAKREECLHSVDYRHPHRRHHKQRPKARKLLRNRRRYACYCALNCDPEPIASDTLLVL
jgi:hypothetical protein